MAQSIRERIPELAILKTLGFSDGTVTALVLGEALLLLLLGGGARHGGRRQPDARRSTAPPAAASRRCSWTPSTWLMAARASRSGWRSPIGLPPALRVRRLRIVDALAGHR